MATHIDAAAHCPPTLIVSNPERGPAPRATDLVEERSVMTDMTTEQVPSDQSETGQDPSDRVDPEHGPSETADQYVEVNGSVEVTGSIQVIGDSEVSTEAELHAEGEHAESTPDADEAEEAAEAEEAEEADGLEEDDGSEAEGSGSKKASGLRRLEEEGEVAADYLEELLDIVDLDGDIDIDVENGRASVAIVAENGAERDLRRLVGAKGEVLEALQDLARLAVQARTGERSRLMLDVAGHRAARRRALEDIAARACQEVARTSSPVRLDPMSAFERKVVHDVVAEAGLVSESEGEDPGRRVVIHPAGS